MRLDDFYLNKNEKSAVLSYCRRNAFPQTVLIEGGSMEDRIDFARLIANMIVCTSDGEKPCGVCSACIKCRAGSHPDVKEYGEAKEKYTFKVDTSREIRSDAFVIPNDADRKVYIIKEAQNMNDASENALLKILEEPPHFDYFIMTCPSRSAMLDTVLSRCAVISLGFSEESFDEDTLSLSGEIIEALCSGSELELVEKTGRLANERELFLPCIGCLKRIVLEALKCKCSAEYDSRFRQSVSIICGKLSQAKIYALTEALNELEFGFKQNANYNLLITYMSVRLKNTVR